MAKNYNERLAETRARSLQDNQALYQQRSTQRKDSGVLERVILEQIRSSGNQEGNYHEEGNYHDRGEYLPDE